MGKGLFLILLVFFSSWAFQAKAATYYMPDNCASLQACAQRMSGGDTLIIRDGTYSGSSNVLSELVMPPSGTSGGYTIIKAENDGRAYFPDGFCHTQNNVSRQYLQFEGLKSRGVFNINGNGNGTTPNYYRILRCSFEGIVDGTVVGVVGATYVLFEDCWAYGKGSYKYVAYAPTYGQTHHIVYRRCVAQIDDVYGSLSNHISGFTAYRSDSVAYQNCIVLGGEHDEFWYVMQQNSNIERGRAYYPVHGASNTTWQGCMALDIKGDAISGAPSGSMDISDFVALNVARLIWTRESGEGTTPIFARYTINRATVRTIRRTTLGLKDQGGSGLEQYNATSGSIRVYNSVLSDIQPSPAFNGGAIPISDYNCLYGNTSNYSGISAGAHDLCSQNSNAIDPTSHGLLYPVRIESGSALSGTGSSGSDRGATILWKTGVDGTFYGQTGWNTTRNAANGYGGEADKLWPWPNEDRIKTDMAAYSSGVRNIIPSGTGTLSGARGFAAGTSLDGTPQTLTKYIWEYLGNRIPGDIYASGTSNLSPIANAGTDQTISTSTGSADVVLNGSGSSDSDGTISSYTWSEGGNQIATGANPTVTLNAGSHTIQLAVRDNKGAVGTDSVTILISQVAPVEHTYQSFEDSVLWVPGGTQDPTGNGRGWAIESPAAGDSVTIDNIGASGTGHSVKITFGTSNTNPIIWFRSNDKTTDHMPEAAGANRMSFYVRFPAGFPIQTQPYRYHTFQLGTYMHDPSNWSDSYFATSETDHGIHHYYHHLTMEQVGDGWVKYIVNTHPDQAVYSGSTVPPDKPYYYDNFGRFYLQFGPNAGGPDPGRPFSIWIDEVKFYYDDGSVGGQVHDGGQNDSGFDGQFIPDGSVPGIPTRLRVSGSGS